MQTIQLLGTLAILATIPPAQAAPVHLVDLMPAQVEFGMTEAGNATWGLAKGPGVIDLGSWGGQQAMPWTDSRKIVKAIKPDFKLPEGSRYSSFMPDVVAVEGDFVTGVCLLAMSNCMYHWMEYAIPAGATNFTGKFYTTDDVSGGGRFAHIASGQANPNQDLIVRITVDGTAKYEKHFNRLKVAMGTGTLIDPVAIELPSGAKTIRMYLESTTFPDNLHNEIVIRDGQFVP